MATKRHVFLDRDGTINVMPSYLDVAFDSPRSVSDFVFIDGALEAIVRLAECHFVHVVTNHPMVAYGSLPDEELAHAINDAMVQQVVAAGGRIDSVRCCFFTDNWRRIKTDALRARYYRENHPWRKPNPGMLLDIGKQFDVDFAQAVMIGDRASDMEAGQRAGCGVLILVFNPSYPDERFDGAIKLKSLAEAAAYVLEQLP